MELRPEAFRNAVSVEQEERFATPMAAILEELERDRDEIMQFADLEDEQAATEASREYVIAGIPTVAEIRRLTELPFEVSITEHEGRLILSTGTTSAASHEYMIADRPIDPVNDRHYYSKVSLHTHPRQFSPADRYEATVPSYSDINSAIGDSKPQIIAGPNEVLLLGFASDVTHEEIQEILSNEEESRRLENIDQAYEVVLNDLEKISDYLGDRIMMRSISWGDPNLEQELDSLFDIR